MEQGTRVRFGVAISAVRSYRLLVPFAGFLAAAVLISSLLPATGLWSLGSSALLIVAAGYTVSVTRSVYLGANELPPLGATLAPAVRRGASSSLVIFIPTVIFVLLVGISSLLANFIDDSSVTALLIGVMIVGNIPLAVLIWAAWTRYIAFDRLREGLRYIEAWRVFTAHVQAAARVGGFWLVGTLALTVIRFGLLTLAGLDSFSAQAEWTSAIGRGSVLRGVAIVVIVIAFAVASGLWQLVLAHLVGQYLAIAYPIESSSPSV